MQDNIHDKSPFEQSRPKNQPTQNISCFSAVVSTVSESMRNLRGRIFSSESGIKTGDAQFVARHRTVQPEAIKSESGSRTTILPPDHLLRPTPPNKHPHSSIASITDDPFALNVPNRKKNKKHASWAMSTGRFSTFYRKFRPFSNSRVSSNTNDMIARDHAKIAYFKNEFFNDEETLVYYQTPNKDTLGRALNDENLASTIPRSNMKEVRGSRGSAKLTDDSLRNLSPTPESRFLDIDEPTQKRSNGIPFPSLRLTNFSKKKNQVVPEMSMSQF